MGSWLKGCEICNAGLITEVDRLVESGGMSVRKACDLMAKEGKRKIGDMVYTSAAIRGRYIHYKGLVERKKEEVVETQPPDTTQTHNQSDSTESGISESENRQPPQEEVEPEADELSAAHHTESAKASADAAKPKPTELEKASKTITKASKYLERIVEGSLKDNGTDDDRLSAESIRRHGPSIIISFYQLGIDPEKAVNFYKGEHNVKDINNQGNLRIQGNAEDYKDKDK